MTFPEALLMIFGGVLMYIVGYLLGRLED